MSLRTFKFGNTLLNEAGLASLFLSLLHKMFSSFGLLKGQWQWFNLFKKPSKLSNQWFSASLQIGSYRSINLIGLGTCEFINQLLGRVINPNFLLLGIEHINVHCVMFPF